MAWRSWRRFDAEEILPRLPMAWGGAKGYSAAALQHGAGTCNVHAEIAKFVYD